MALKNLKDLLEHQIKDLYSAETQLIDAMPDMIDAANNPKLKNALQEHLQEAKRHKQRIEEIAEKMGIQPTGETCKAMKGLIRETRGMIDEEATNDVKDAGLIADIQRIKHYEIAGYGVARAFAQMLDLDEVRQLLAKTLENEKDVDELLNDLAMEHINKDAKSGSRRSS